MFLILYQADHAARATALATSLSATALDIDSPPSKSHISTLIFWGHGDILRLCNKKSPEIIAIVKAWKKLNSGLKTVEIITCNSGHAPTGNEAFCRQLKDGLNTWSTKGITVKAMPVNFGGSNNGFSILLAHAPNKTWCYISARSDTAMFNGVKAVKGIAKENGYNLADAANVEARNPSRERREYTLNYGTFDQLRNHLSVVH